MERQDEAPNDDGLIPEETDFELKSTNLNAVSGSALEIMPFAGSGVAITAEMTGVEFFELANAQGAISVPTGVTVTLTSTATINTNLTITGGGTIQASSSWVAGTNGANLFSITGGTTTLTSVTLDASGRLNADGTVDVTGKCRVAEVGDSATLIIDDGATLTGGNTAINAGGVFVNGSNARLTLNDGGKITGNYSVGSGSRGGGVGIHAGSFIMNGGEISNNVNAATGTDGMGGGVSIAGSSGKFTMNGGTIKDNIAGGMGGGVAVNVTQGGIFFTMNGGTITGNKAESGGGVAISNGDIIIGSISKIDISGNTVNGEPNNVYIAGGTYKVKLNGAPVAQSKIGVTTNTKPNATTTVDVAFAGTHTPLVTDMPFFFSDSPLYRTTFDGTDKIVLELNTPLYVHEDKSSTSQNGSFAYPFLTIADAYEAAPATAEIRVLSDLTVSATTEFSDNKTVKVVAYSDETTPKIINSYTDSFRVKRDSNWLTPKQPLFSMSGGNVTFEGVLFDGDNVAVPIGSNGSPADPNTIGIRVTGGTLNLNKGAGLINSIFSGTTGSWVTAGVMLWGSTLNMYDGAVVRGNYSWDTGGVFVYSPTTAAATFNMYGGEISNNEATGHGGGIIVRGEVDTYRGKFNMSGGDIKNNYLSATSGGGGGICLYQYADAKLSGTAKITGNAIASPNMASASGVWPRTTTTTFSVSGSVQINRNVIAVDTSDVTRSTSGDKSLTINTVSKDESNIYLPTGVNVLMSGALTSGANIGVNVQDMPTETTKVRTVATGAVLGDQNFFFSDKPTAAGIIFEDNTVKLSYADRVLPETKLYVHMDKAGETTSDGSYEKPYKTVEAALGAIGTKTGSTFEIVLLSGVDYTTHTTVPNLAGNNKTITIKSETGNKYTISNKGGSSALTSSQWHLPDDTGTSLILENITFDWSQRAGAANWGDFFIGNGCTLTLGNGATFQNSGTNGANRPINIRKGGTVIMLPGSKITGFTAGANPLYGGDGYTGTPQAGGAVYVCPGGTFEMRGGEISGNFATSGAAGVYGEGGATIKMSGTPIVKNNTMNGTASNVYLGVYNSQQQVINLTAPLTDGAEINVYVDPMPSTSGAKTDIAKGADSYTAQESDKAFFHSDQPTKAGIIFESSTVKLSYDAAVALNDRIRNGSFEQPKLSKSGYQLYDAAAYADLLIWNTTASDKKVELSNKGSLYGISGASEGTQFAELNANLESTLYQTLTLTPGTYYLQFDHSGRRGIDQMNVMIGLANDFNKGTGTFTGNHYVLQVSTGSGWKTYSEDIVIGSGGIINISEATEIVFAFKSVSSASGNKAVGNLLDNINFMNYANYPNEIAGLKGKVNTHITTGLEMPTGTGIITVSPTEGSKQYVLIGPDGKVVETKPGQDGSEVTFTGLMPGQKYQVVVIGQGETPPAVSTTPDAEFTKGALDADVPSVDGNATATPSLTDDKMDIIINPSSDKVKYAVVGSDGSVVDGWTDGNNSTITFTGLTPGEKYEIVTVPLGEPTTGTDWSGKGTAITLPKSPVIERIPSTTENDKDKIVLNPTEPDQEYTVYVPGEQSPPFTWTDGTGTELVFDNLDPTKTYEVITRKKPADIPTEPVTVLPITNAATPSIDSQPQSATANVDESITLSVTASVDGVGTLSYQWYSSTTDSDTNGTPISNATSATYTPPTSNAGTTYYYVIVTNTNDQSTGTKTATATSNVATVTVLKPEDVPNAIIDYTAEKLTGLTPGADYIIGTTVYPADAGGKINIDPSWIGTPLSIVKKGNGTTTSDSPAQSLSIPSRTTSAPTTPVGGVNKITSVDDTMEYRLKPDGTWTSVPASATEVTGLTAGAYEVRYKATGTTFASEPISVIVTDLTPEATLNAAIDFTAEQLTGLTPNAVYRINGEEYTADADGKIDINPSWIGTPLSIVKKGNGTTTSDSPAQSLSIPSRTTSAPTTPVGGVNKITTVDDTMEYRLKPDGTWTFVPASATEVTGIPAGTYDVRYKATGNAFASEPISVIVTDLTPEATPNAAIDFTAEQLTGLTPNAVYIINGEEYTADADGKIDINPSWIGTTLSIVKKGNGTTTSDSPAQSLPIPSRTTSAPTTPVGGVNKITSVDDTMEYRLKPDGTWTSVPASATEVIGIPAGTYDVRYKATGTTFASDPVSVTVSSLIPEATPNAAIDFTAEQLTNLTPNALYSINGAEYRADADGKIDINPSWIGTPLSIVKKGNGTTTSDSPAQSLPIPSRTTSAPTTPVGGVNKITSVDDTMEYRLKPDGTWTSVPASATEVIGIPAGTYDVRYKATGTTFASEAASVNVTNLLNAEMPTITTQPQGKIMNVVGETVALTAKANISDGGTLTYQWYRNTTNSNTGGSAIPGATSANYSVTTNTAGTIYYYVAVTNTNNSANGTKTRTARSAVAAVTVNLINAETPSITTHPQGKAVNVGENAELSVTVPNASDGGTLTYQWYRNTTNSNIGGSAIPGATSATYNAPTTSIGTGYYYVVVTNTNNIATGAKTNTVTSNVTAITVNNLVNAQMPNITTQPQGISVNVGENATLSVAAGVSDGGTLTYQWYRTRTNSNTGGSIIPGATSATYKASTGSAGTIYYYAVVTNLNTGATGVRTSTATSSPATVTVTSPVYGITGKVVEFDDINVPGASVELMQGSTRINTISTDDNGNFELSGILPGTYNLVVTKSDRIVTHIIVITDKNHDEGTIKLPKLLTNSKVEIQPGSPDIIVGNLGEQLSETNSLLEDLEEILVEGGKVEIIFNGEEKTADANPETIADVSKIDSILPPNHGVGLLLDLKVNKEVYKHTDLTNPDSTSRIPTLDTVLEIIVPLPDELQGRPSYSVLRVHEGTATELPKLNAKPTGSTEGFMENKDIDGMTFSLTIYARSFSTYAIAAPISAEKPILISQPQGKTVNIGETAELSVEASVSDGGTLTYQWYSNTANSNTDGTLIPGATSETYSAPTGSAGTTYYYVVVTNTNNAVVGNNASTETSNTVAVTVNSGSSSNGYSGSSSSSGGSGGGTISNATVTSPVNGSVTISPNNPVNGSKVTITVKPNTGYVLDKLTITDGNNNSVSVTDNGNGTFTYTQPSSRVRITATFAAITAVPDVPNVPDVPAVTESNDSDVSRLLNTVDHYAYVSGRGNDQFAPSANMSRAEASQMFYNLLNDKNVAITKSFPDVSSDAWYAEAVGALATLGIISGYPDGGFRPNETITRAEFATMVVRFATVSQGSARFADVPSTHWAYAYVNTAANYSWVSGVGDNKFEPDRNINRAEAVTLTNRMLNRYPDKVYIDASSSLTRFTDINASHWAYYNIMEAANAHGYEKNGTVETWK